LFFICECEQNRLGHEQMDYGDRDELEQFPIDEVYRYAGAVFQLYQYLNLY